MAKPAEKLKESLKVLKEHQTQHGLVLKASQLSRTHRERLVANGFIREVIKGWYIPTRPDEQPGESTAWYASYWDFCAEYLTYRFEEAWCLSPEQSLTLFAGNRTVPEQLIVRSPKASNNVTSLIFDTSLFDVKASLPPKKETEVMGKLRLFSISAALISSSPIYFQQNPEEVRAILASINDVSPLLELLLDGGHSKVAGRLAAAFRKCGQGKIANQILNSMKAAGYDVREKNPFNKSVPDFQLKKPAPPAVTRLIFMWDEMRRPIIDIFPKERHKPISLDQTLQQIEDIYVQDAYHSLSIEGYRVTEDLIERVTSGEWNPDSNDKDKEHRDALAARGYWLAFQSVKESIIKVLEGNNPGNVADDNIALWFQSLFSPSITAGLLRPGQLAGYRNDQVFIRRSRHVPPSKEMVRELMPAFFDLLKNETSPEVRVVLGHFLFVYIHPYMDGNGRIGRFLMNLMMIAAGYNWTIIPVQERLIYFESLEAASVSRNIVPFTQFLMKCMARKPNEFKET
jgi:hypothetical protein